MTISDTGRNGILFTGSTGRLFVNRESLSGKPIEELSQHPLPREKFTAYRADNHTRPPRAGKLEAIVNHMGNFFDCIQSRQTPISDIESQHRTANTCHLANISLRAGRALKWNPHTETIVDDPQANSWLSRPQRHGFEIR